MKARVFGGNMSILINGCPTEKICIQRNLNKGDSLAPFLFHLVAKGFGRLMRNAVSQSMFKGFDFGNQDLVVSHLQYADDTLCIGKASMENLWTLKSSLRGFELVSRPKVIF